jgi:hypothetical protein
MIVPHGALGVVSQSPSLAIQASKRYKVTKGPRSSSGESENLPVTPPSQQCSFSPSYTTDSEMIDFEEGSSDNLISVESDRGILDLTGNDRPQDNRNNVEVLDSGLSANMSMSAF